MPLETIYVTRHGFRTSWSVDPMTGVYSASIPTPTGIAADPALTSHGVDQAKELARHLTTLDPPIDAVYSSPYYRCLQTIEPFVELQQQQQQQLQPQPSAPSKASAAIRPENGLCEWFGSAPFEHPRPASPEVLKALFPAYDDSYVSALTPSSKGETVAQLYARVAAATQAIIDRCDAEGTRAVVLCSHAAVIIILGRILTGEVPDSVEIDDFKAFTCGLSVYRRRPVTHRDVASPARQRVALGGWDCTLNGDCSFLTTGEERGWKFAGDESFPGTGSLSQAEAEPKL